VTEPGAFLEAPHEASRLVIGAAVPVQAGQNGEQAFGKPRQTVGRPGLKAAEIELDADHRREAVEVRTPVDAPLDHAHGARRPLHGNWNIVVLFLVMGLAHGPWRADLRLRIVTHVS
jgi:hypothetical protein